ncbi:mechanosensitive ion channel protein [Salipiger aestuarii]|uniref:mechanosensitive ion channel family protein n=1 Tax=Salipiger aestuarii TaxID=568098 RepID=UPI00123ADDEA|nr:mechanosensitive ion channel family protein [Salipiger aestuarii]KAA8606072.1 mechanosensitive ion channel protein [Salipiger aestuarii]
MKLVSRLRQLIWPFILLLVALGLVIFDREVEQWVGLSLGGASSVVGCLAAAWLGSRLFGLFADGRRRHKRPYPRLFQDLVAVLLFFTAVVASAALLLGQGLLGALAGSSLILAMLGFAIRNVVADTLSGIALGVEAPYRIGDWVDIEQVARGRVIEIGWRTTRVLTQDSTYMILPNSQIALRRITNYSAPKPQYRGQLSLKLTHELPVDTAKALILKALREARLIQSDPPPDVRVQELGSDSNTYAVRFWLAGFEADVDCRDEVLSLIDRAMRHAKIPAPRKQIELNRPQSANIDPVEFEMEVARVFAAHPKANDFWRSKTETT